MDFIQIFGHLLDIIYNLLDKFFRVGNNILLFLNFN